MRLSYVCSRVSTTRRYSLPDCMRYRKPINPLHSLLDCLCSKFRSLDLTSSPTCTCLKYPSLAFTSSPKQHRHQSTSPALLWRQVCRPQFVFPYLFLAIVATTLPLFTSSPTYRGQMVLQHVLFSTIAKAILPLAAFENNFINPSAIAVGLNPPCLAAQLADWYDRVNPSFNATAVEWPTQYSQDCLDCVFVALSADDHDAMITAMAFPTQMPVSFSITVENTDVPVHSRTSTQLLSPHGATIPASTTKTCQAGTVLKTTATPTHRCTPAQAAQAAPSNLFPTPSIWQYGTFQPIFNTSCERRNPCKFSCNNITILEYAVQLVFAVFGLLAFLHLRSFGVKVVKKSVPGVSPYLTKKNEEELQLAAPLNTHLLPGRIVIRLQQSIAHLQYLMRHYVSAVEIAKRKNLSLTQQLAQEKARNKKLTQSLADKDAEQNALEKNLVVFLLELADKTTHIAVLQHWGRLLCHKHATLSNEIFGLNTRDLSLRGIVMVKEAQIEVLRLCKEHLNTENARLKGANTSLRIKSVQTRGVLSTKATKTRILSSRNTCLASERFKLKTENTSLRIDNVQTRGLLTIKAIQTQLFSYRNAELSNENSELKRDLAKAVIAYAELEHDYVSKKQDLNGTNDWVHILTDRTHILESTIDRVRKENGCSRRTNHLLSSKFFRSMRTTSLI